MVSGDSKTMTVTVDDGAETNPTAIDISGFTIWWWASRRDSSGIFSSTATLQKDNAGGGGVAITDTANGKFQVTLAPADTAALSGDFYHEAQVRGRNWQHLHSVDRQANDRPRPRNCDLGARKWRLLWAPISYVSVAGADTYWSERNNLGWEVADTVDKEKALRFATEFIDGVYDGSWIGEHPGTSTQTLAWPRNGAVDGEGRSVTGIPQRVRDAVSRLALEALSDFLSAAEDRGGRIARARVGPLNVSYFRDAPAGTAFPLSRAHAQAFAGSW